MTYHSLPQMCVCVILEALLDLLIELVILDGSVCTRDHYPIWLSAYTASMSQADQKLLILLYLYEQAGANTIGFRLVTIKL